MINSVLKALDILAIFSSSEPRLSLATISQRMGLPKSTVHNLLATLLSRGYIERVDNDHYALGTEIIVLSQSTRVNVELRDRAAPLLRQLADTCHESVYLTTRQSDRTLYIYAIESPRRLMARTAIGERVLLHCTSNGKAILSCLPDSDVTAFAERTRLPAFTENTITNVNILKKELEIIHSQGYSLDREEHELRTFCIGAPIFDGNTRVIGACSISGNDPEIIASRLLPMADQVKYTAQEISRRLGYVSAVPSQVVDGFDRRRISTS